MKKMKMLSVKLVLPFLLYCLLTESWGQELFPINEPASTLPKNSILTDVFFEYYDENQVRRSMLSAGINYGLTKNITVRASLIGSDHHNDTLPDMRFHRHAGPGRNYDFKYSGLNLYAKYRFFNRDKEKEHFRMALYGRYSAINEAHDEAEPDLLDDNSGYGIGLITTRLHKWSAVSLTLGYNRPFDYQEQGVNGTIKKLNFGDAFTYSLSVGRLLFPSSYISHSQNNHSIYLEFMGKVFPKLQYFENDLPIELMQDIHEARSYLEGKFGFQRVMLSHTRLEATIGFNIIDSPQAYTNPVITLSWKRLLFL